MSDINLQKLIEDIEHHKTLGHDWDSYGADAVSHKSIEQAKQFIIDLYSKQPTIMASPQGHIVMEGDSYTIEFTHRGPEIYFD